MTRTKSISGRIARKIVHVVVRDFTNQIMDTVVRFLTKKNNIKK